MVVPISASDAAEAAAKLVESHPEMVDAVHSREGARAAAKRILSLATSSGMKGSVLAGLLSGLPADVPPLPGAPAPPDKSYSFCTLLNCSGGTFPLTKNHNKQ
jgi:hypothetical protein